MNLCRLILLIFFVAAESVSARPARVILLRHAEKPPDESTVHLSERGESRARALVALLEVGSVVGSNGPPAALFAPKFTRQGRSRRPYETLEPLAEHLKLSVQTPYGPSDYAALAKDVLSDSRTPDIGVRKMSAFFLMTAPGSRTSVAGWSRERPLFFD
jgi:hypothetical protein